jgi:putative restriction endonuclease
MMTMDDHRTPYRLHAPGASGSRHALRLPGRDPFPGVDDHLVQPEVTRDQIIAGRLVVAFPAKGPHATQHTRLAYVLDAHVAPGYEAATDLLTRYSEDSDFATDACVAKKGIDPATGDRYLEEIAFEVISKQKERHATTKAQRMHQRGVRRIFAIWVKGQRICEWSPERQAWRRLEADAKIEDPCLVRPLPVAALLDAALADDAVAEALNAKDNRVIRRLKAEGKAEGRAEALAESILKVLAARGIAVSAAERERILDCHDLDRLDRWLLRATQASSAAEVTRED